MSPKQAKRWGRFDVVVPGVEPAPCPSMRVFRWVWMCWVVGWFVRWFYYLNVYKIHHAYPMSHPSITGWQADPNVMLGAMVLPAFLSVGMLRITRARMLVVSILSLACSTVLLNHIVTFNDATYVSSFWVSVWMVWMAWNCERQDPQLIQESKRLSLMVVSLMFLGGFMGKLTPAYWSGEMYSQFPLIREALSPQWLTSYLSTAQHHQVFVWASRLTVIMEGCTALLCLAPFRVAAPLMALAMFSIMAGMTFYLICVFSCLIGLIVAHTMWRAPSLVAEAP